MPTLQAHWQPPVSPRNRRSSEFNDFVAKCTAKDPAQRPTAEELLQHPFVKDATNLGPVKDLFKLIEAEVEEVLEDLPEEESQRIAENRRLSMAATKAAQDELDAALSKVCMEVWDGRAASVDF